MIRRQKKRLGTKGNKVMHGLLGRALAILLIFTMVLTTSSISVFAEEQTPQQQLETLLDEIYALNSEDYTEDSWNELKEQADSVNRPVTPYDEATGVGMPDWVANLMITNLTNLVNALVPVSSQKTVYEQLEEKLQEAEALDSSKYTEETWTQVKEIIDSADRPVSSENITEELATKLLADIEKAIAGLEEKASNDIVLEDGTYIAWIDTSAINYLMLPRAKVVAKDGKYQVTLYSVGSVSDTFDSNNVRYRVCSRDDYQFDMVEVVKPEFNGKFEKGSEYFSNKKSC